MSEIKRVKPKRKPMSIVVSIVLLAGAGYFLYQAGTEIWSTYQLTKELQTAQSLLDEIQSENQYLTEQKEKLEDPEYVKSYARGTYMLSKDGEQIFYLPSTD
ncbi:hypothetical protein SDC9_105059 [bioreactor metagenome]|uniref:Cell division protein FtsL n=1 Tax=bioreactor metagenome TaxID=1076179 RepID=A0A645AZL3_9ZZZZ|nr:septum formation initiator family protein [Erysipelotrichaceae bacterium]